MLFCNLGCNECLFERELLPCLLFRTVLCKPQRWLCGKIPPNQQFLKHSVWNQQPCYIFFPDFEFEPQQVTFIMSAWQNALSCCHVIDWLDLCVCVRARVCACVGTNSYTGVPNKAAGMCISSIYHTAFLVIPLQVWHGTSGVLFTAAVIGSYL